MDINYRRGAPPPPSAQESTLILKLLNRPPRTLYAMRCTVFFTPPRRYPVTPAAVAVVDALRATTSIVAAFERHAAAVVAVDGIRRAVRLRASHRDADAVLCGERGGLPPPGFDLGNSPAELLAHDWHGRMLLLATTNGTRALVGAPAGVPVAAAALRNRAAVARWLAVGGSEDDALVAVTCAGEAHGHVIALEDVVVAGAIVDALVASGARPDDAARLALAAWRRGPSPNELLLAADHAAALVKLGLEHDIEAAAKVDVTDLVPRVVARPDDHCARLEIGERERSSSPRSR